MTRCLVFLCIVSFCNQGALADIYSASDSLRRGDYESAAAEFKRLAEQGDAKAAAHLGYMYYVGEGVPQSYEEANKWYRKAAVKGDLDAQYNLAVTYAFGEGTKQDYKEAALWYRRAAEQGHAIAQYSLGVSYSYGEGVPQDSKEAARWFTKSAEQGYVRAQVLLGSKYHIGDGVPQDYEQAVYWYRKAADRGDAAAQYNLGSMFRSGKGVTQDYNQAIRWFRLAADQGYAAAQNELASLERVIAGAARTRTTPYLQPEPIERKEEAVKSSVPEPTATADIAQAESGSISNQMPEQKPLLTVDKSDLLTLEDKKQDEEDSGISETQTPEEIELIDETAATTQTITSEEENAVLREEKKSRGVRGFFGRLFKSNKDEIESKPDAIETEPQEPVVASTQMTETETVELAIDESVPDIDKDGGADDEEQESPVVMLNEDSAATPSSGAHQLLAMESIKPSLPDDSSPLDGPLLASIDENTRPDQTKQDVETWNSLEQTVIYSKEYDERGERKKSSGVFGLFGKLFSRKESSQPDLNETEVGDEQIDDGTDTDVQETVTASTDTESIETSESDVTGVESDTTVISDNTAETGSSNQEKDQSGYQAVPVMEDDKAEPVITGTAGTSVTDTEAENDSKPGFFKRLFSRKDRNTDTQSQTNINDDTIESIDSEMETSISSTVDAYPEINEEQAPADELPSVAIAEETEIDIGSDVVADEEIEKSIPIEEEQKPRFGFFKRLFGKEAKQQEETVVTSEATVTHATEETAPEPEVFPLPTSEQEPIGAESTAIQATAEVEAGDDTGPAVVEDEEIEESNPIEEEQKPRFGFFKRLFGKDNENKQPEDNVAGEEAAVTNLSEQDVEMESETATADVPEENITAETEPALTAGDNSQEDTFTLDDITVTAAEDEAVAAVNTEPESIEEELQPEAKKPGFFSRLFGKKKEQPAEEPTVVSDDDEPAGADENATISEDITVLTEESTEEDAVEEENKQESGGFFSRLFGKPGHTAGTSDDRDNTVTNPTGSEVQSEQQDISENTEEQLTFRADPEELRNGMLALDNRNYETAYNTFRSLAVQGDARAQLQLASLYYQGLGTKQSYAEASIWYRRAAEQGEPDAQYSLGNMFLMGEGVEQDDSHASYWYQKAANQGHEAARHNLDNLSRVTKNATNPDSNTDQSSLPVQSNADTQDQTADEVENEVIEQETPKKGFFSRLFNKNDTQEEPTADELPGKDTNIITEADTSTEEDSKKTGFFGRLFSKKDKQQAEMEHEEDTDMQSGNEVMVAKNEPAADIPTTSNNPVKDYERGLSYSFGEGVPKDHSIAFKWFMQAAEQGYAPAQYKVGVSYAFGEGVDKDLSKAAEWYGKAAYQGYAIAQRNLGVMYINGDGVELNKAMALAWYSILADNGNVMDVRRRDSLEQQLTWKEIEQAQQMKQEIKREIH